MISNMKELHLALREMSSFVKFAFQIIEKRENIFKRHNQYMNTICHSSVIELESQHT